MFMDDFATKKFARILKMALFCLVQIKFDALFLVIVVIPRSSMPASSSDNSNKMPAPSVSASAAKKTAASKKAAPAPLSLIHI